MELKLRIAELEGARQILWAQLGRKDLTRSKLRTVVGIVALGITVLQGPEAVEDIRGRTPGVFGGDSSWSEHGRIEAGWGRP